MTINEALAVLQDIIDCGILSDDQIDDTQKALDFIESVLTDLGQIEHQDDPGLDRAMDIIDMFRQKE